MGVTELLPVAVPVGELEEVAVGVGAGVTLLEKETLAVLLGEAPTDKLAVGEEDRVELAESVVDGLSDAVAVPLEVGVGVRVAEGVLVAVAELDKVTLAVLEGLAPGLRLLVGEADAVEL